MNSPAEGPIYSTGTSFRAYAEQHQRSWRAKCGIGFDRHGHWLDAEAVTQGKNFVGAEIHAAAKVRDQSKGVGQRTFQNLCASQAMCFNLFQPLAAGVAYVDASACLHRCLPFVDKVERLTIEYTPDASVFGDQSGKGGVDADVLMEFIAADGKRGVAVIESKFVETSFSHCGYRKAGHPNPCPLDTTIKDAGSTCRYSTRSPSFRYWEVSRRHGVDDVAKLASAPCPFGGPLWQPWVNFTLAHAEAAARGAIHAHYVVCAPKDNRELLEEVDGDTLGAFRQWVRKPQNVHLLTVESLLDAISASAIGEDGRQWATRVRDRYEVPILSHPIRKTVPKS